MKNKEEELIYVDKYFLTEVSLVDEGANLLELNFFKRLGEGGDNKMKKSKDEKANEETPKAANEVLPETDVKEGAGLMGTDFGKITPEALKKKDEENERLQAELKKAEEEMSKFDLAKKGEAFPEVITKPMPEGCEKDENLKAEIERIEYENLKMRYEQALKENERLKSQIPIVRGFDRQPEERPEKLEKEKTKPKTAGEISKGTIFDITEELKTDLSEYPGFGVISEGSMQ